MFASSGRGRRFRLIVACAFVLLMPIVGTATPSPCGKSFIDVDNDGVCTPGDVSIDGLFATLVSRFGYVQIDTNAALVGSDGTTIYTPPADHHRVGLVFGGSVVLGFQSYLNVLATGDIHVNGRLYANDAIGMFIETCGNIVFRHGALLQTQGAASGQQVYVSARADDCPDLARSPSTLEFGKGARVDTMNDLTLIGDRVQFDDHAQLRAFADVVNEQYGFLQIDSGALVFGKGVNITGPDYSQANIDNCGANTTADRLTIKIGKLLWANFDPEGLCNHTLADGTPYNINVGVGQRLALSRSTLWSTAFQGAVEMYANSDDGTLPCDGITLVHTRIEPVFDWFEFSPAPRVDPAAPCAGNAP